MKNFIESVLGRFFPSKCVSCGEITGKYKRTAVLCPECREKWETAKRVRCRVCGMAVSDCFCGEGDMYLSGIRDHLKLVFYTKDGDVAGKLIYSLKRCRNREVTAFAAEECARQLEEYLILRNISPQTVVITFPPRTSKERRANGGDHSERVARAVADMVGCGFARTLFRKGGKKQRELSFAERKINVENSIFSIEKISLLGKTVVLFDDVVTSGTTMSRAAVLLRRMGASEIIALSPSKTRKYF